MAVDKPRVQRLDRSVLLRLFAERHLPEGAVRRRVVYELIRRYGVLPAAIAIEVPAGAGREAERLSTSVRADVVVYRDAPHAEPVLVIEVKAPRETGGVGQAESYARNLGAPAFVVVRGDQVECYRTGFGKPSSRATYPDLNGDLKPGTFDDLLGEIGLSQRDAAADDVVWLAERLSHRDGEIWPHVHRGDRFDIELRLHSITAEEAIRLLAIGGKTYKSNSRLHWKLQGNRAALLRRLVEHLTGAVREEAEKTLAGYEQSRPVRRERVALPPIPKQFTRRFGRASRRG